LQILTKDDIIIEALIRRRKMTIKKINVILLATFISLCSCNARKNTNDKSSDEAFTRDVFAMDTYMSLKAYGSNAEKALTEAENRITDLEKTLSVTSEGSDIWKLNHSGGKSVSVSDDTIELIKKAAEVGKDTDGSLDITLYPLLKEWGFTTGEYKIPDTQKLDELLNNVDYSRISIKGEEITLPRDVEIDLGALAKGYTGDEVLDIMKENGVSSAIVSLGGNVQALGSKPDGSDWKVAVRDPFAPETDMCVVEISGKAVITSGNYERFFTGNDGKNYWHILDPNDGYPADNGLVSVTIIGKNGLECDALSTALFVLGYDKTIDYLKKHPENDVILVTDDKKVYYSDGIAEKFTNISSMPAEVIAVD
jgi:thiamine biosynthesis lipoprotein